MGATPNFDTAGNDDVSFNRGTASGSQTTHDSIQQNIESGMDKVQDKAQSAMSQLQTKASEVTSRLVDSIDVDDLTQKLEHQVREHPARTLLIAAGAGFMLGRSLQRSKH